MYGLFDDFRLHFLRLYLLFGFKLTHFFSEFCFYLHLSLGGHSLVLISKSNLVSATKTKCAVPHFQGLQFLLRLSTFLLRFRPVEQINIIANNEGTFQTVNQPISQSVIRINQLNDRHRHT